MVLDWGGSPCTCCLLAAALMAHCFPSLPCGNSAVVISSPQVHVCPCLEICLGWLKIELTTLSRAVSKMVSKFFLIIRGEALESTEIPKVIC